LERRFAANSIFYGWVAAAGRPIVLAEVFNMVLRNTILAVLSAFTAAAMIVSSALGEPVSNSPKDSAGATWDVGVPHVPSDTLEFDATEGTWITVDVSPDGKALVFDLLGNIYTGRKSSSPATAAAATISG
jgi:hypothetical protein